MYSVSHITRRIGINVLFFLETSSHYTQQIPIIGLEVRKKYNRVQGYEIRTNVLICNRCTGQLVFQISS